MNKQIFGVAIGAVGGFAACWLIVGMSGCGKGADLIATVNGESITVDEYYKYLEFKPEVRVATESGPVNLKPVGSLGFQALQDLIGQKVTMQLAKDKKIYPTEAEVTKELEFKKKLQPNYLNTLTGIGYSFDMIRQSLTLDLIRERLLTAGITVTAAEADAYRAANKAEFKEPARGELSMILVQDKQTQKKVDQELAGGQSFTQVALRYSAAPDVRATNARLRDANGNDPALGSLPANVQKAIEPFVKGAGTGTTEWIPLVDGYAKFYLAKFTKEQDIVMDDARKEALRRLLAQKKGAEGRDINRQVLLKLKESKVDVRRTAFQDPWKKAYQQFMQENKLEGITGSRGAN